MREVARIQFRGDKAAFIAEWNSHSEIKVEYGVVAIQKDDAEYERMRQLFAAFAKEHTITWFERVTIEYSEAELESFELLTLQVTGRAGAGNNKLATVYSVERTCEVCGRVVYHQIRNLVLDFAAKETDPLEAGYFQHDLCETDFGEIVVSEKVKSLFEAEGVPKVRFRPVEMFSTEVAILIPYYQLHVESRIGPLVAPSQIQRLGLCNNCGEYSEVVLDAWPGTKESELYFSRLTYRGDSIMETADRFGRLPNFRAKLIISQRLYRLLRASNVTGFWVEPAHLVDPLP